ncbi:DUF6444 domain-containing protein [Marinobacterium sedimentorum]|uniref:DUF6444 domain-containing protein n=1 Tax=Marinobacterium sedimentorum TaxID=2927804 RepID=UPI003F65908D
MNWGRFEGNWKQASGKVKEQLGDMTGRLNTNSANSSKPPSQDPNRPKKIRSKGERKPGGQPGEALPVLDEALQLAQHTQEGFYEAELYRLRGDCLLAVPAAPDARVPGTPEDCFLKAIELARGQGARLLQTRPALARELLKAICSAAPQDDETAFGSTANALLAKLDGAG